MVSTTLRKNRKERYRSAHELLKALKDLRRNLEFEAFFMNGFFNEVKRRKVYRVAVAYIIAAAGMIQLASAAFPAWDLPNSALRLVIVLLLIVFHSRSFSDGYLMSLRRAFAQHQGQHWEHIVAVT